MSWLKKTFHKVKKSVKRASHGKFHIGHGIRSASPKFLRKFVEKTRWSRLVKSRMFGNNSASVVPAYDSGYAGSGYTYNGRSVSELM